MREGIFTDDDYINFIDWFFNNKYTSHKKHDIERYPKFNDIYKHFIKKYEKTEEYKNKIPKIKKRLATINKKRLKEGKELKELNDFFKSTVYKKLKDLQKEPAKIIKRRKHYINIKKPTKKEQEKYLEVMRRDFGSLIYIQKNNPGEEELYRTELMDLIEYRKKEWNSNDPEMKKFKEKYGLEKEEIDPSLKDLLRIENVKLCVQEFANHIKIEFDNYYTNKYNLDKDKKWVLKYYFLYEAMTYFELAHPLYRGFFRNFLNFKEIK